MPADAVNSHTTLRPRQNGRLFADDIFKCIFLNENVWFPIKISLKFVPKGLINNIISLVQIMVWRRPGDKPLSGPMIVSLPTHICVARPQWDTVDCVQCGCPQKVNCTPLIALPSGRVTCVNLQRVSVDELCEMQTYYAVSFSENSARQCSWGLLISVLIKMMQI